MSWYSDDEKKSKFEQRAYENRQEARELWHQYKKAEGHADPETVQRLHDRASAKYKQMAKNIAISRNYDNDY